MYKLEYKDTHYQSEKDMMDFTSFLDKLAYQMIFYGKFAKKRKLLPADLSKDGVNKKRSLSTSDRDLGEDGDDELETEHNLVHYDASFTTNHRQTTRRNCRNCNKHRTLYYCVDCSGALESDFLWVCSFCPVKIFEYN